MIKLILSDLDGTLNRDQNSSDDKIKNSIRSNDVKQLHKIILTGIKVGIVTGNNLTIAKKQTQQIKDIISITSTQNGSFIYDSNNKILNTNFFSPFLLFNLLQYLNRHNFIYVCENEKYEYFPNHLTNEDFQNLLKLNYNSILKPVPIKLTNICKIQIKYNLENKFQEPELIISKLKTEFPNITFVIGDSHTIDVFPIETSKKNSIITISKLLDVKLDEIAYFGDNQNDISAFQLIENSFVISTSPKSVQQYAKYVVKDVSQGIHQILKGI